MAYNVVRPTKDYFYIYANYIEKAMQHDSAHGGSPISPDRQGVMPHIQTITVGPDGTIYINGDDSKYKIIPVKGKSAYEIACEYGYVGTEQEWLDSLKANVGYYNFENTEESEDN